MSQRNDLVRMAASYIGKKEATGGHKPIIDTYNAHKPLARGYKVKYTDEWCATFVSAMAILSHLTDIIPTECSCMKMIDLFKKQGAWQENDAYTPKPGDVIFYDWQDSGAGDNIGHSDHVGIVESVSGSTIKVIEGNMSAAVGRRSIKVNGRYIRGYGVPKFKESAGATSGTPAKTDAAMYKDKQISGTYKTTAALNMRAGAGTDKKILQTIPKGASVTCYGYYNKTTTGTKWLYVAYKNISGYCSDSYLKKI